MLNRLIVTPRGSHLPYINLTTQPLFPWHRLPAGHHLCLLDDVATRHALLHACIPILPPLRRVFPDRFALVVLATVVAFNGLDGLGGNKELRGIEVVLRVTVS